MLCNFLNLISIFLTLLVSGSQASAAQNDNHQPHIWKSLENLIKQKCLKNAGQDKYQEVLKELTNLRKFHWHSIIIEEPTFEAHPHVHCELRKPEILGYLERFAQKLESCTEDEESYLQQFILKGYENYSRYFCHHIKSLIADLPGNTTKCIAKFAGNPSISPNTVCFKKSRIFGSNPSADVITKQGLCEDLLNLRYCYAKIFKDHCADAYVLAKFQLGLMSEGLVDCHDVWYMMLKKYLKMQL